MNSKRWLFPCLFRVFMIQISVNTQGSVNSRSSGSTAPITGADLLMTTRIVIEYYSNNINISQSEVVRHEQWHRAETLCKWMRWRVPIPLLRAATCPPVFSSGSKNQNSLFLPTHRAQNFFKRSMMRPLHPTHVNSLWEGPPTCHNLTSDTLPPHF